MAAPKAPKNSFDSMLGQWGQGTPTRAPATPKPGAVYNAPGVNIQQPQGGTQNKLKEVRFQNPYQTPGAVQNVQNTLSNPGKMQNARAANTGYNDNSSTAFYGVQASGAQPGSQPGPTGFVSFAQTFDANRGAIGQRNQQVGQYLQGLANQARTGAQGALDNYKNSINTQGGQAFNGSGAAQAQSKASDALGFLDSEVERGVLAEEALGGELSDFDRMLLGTNSGMAQNAAADLQDASGALGRAQQQGADYAAADAQRRDESKRADLQRAESEAVQAGQQEISNLWQQIPWEEIGLYESIPGAQDFGPDFFAQLPKEELEPLLQIARALKTTKPKTQQFAAMADALGTKMRELRGKYKLPSTAQSRASAEQTRANEERLNAQAQWEKDMEDWIKAGRPQGELN